MEMKKKVASSRALYVSHIEAVQNVVRFHKASSNAGLDEISSLASANAHSIDEVGSNLSFVTCCLLLHFLVSQYLALLNFCNYNFIYTIDFSVSSFGGW